MPGTSVPVIRQPFAEGDLLPFWAYGGLVDRHVLYERRHDPDQARNLAAAPGEPISDLEHQMIEILKNALGSIDTPDDVLVRLGIV
jgi:hypothetical protein